jgi:hypothetical protein
MESQVCNAQACEPPLSALNCTVSSWTDWDACSSACGGGTKSRFRSITQSAGPLGTQCPTLIEASPCNTQGCPIHCEMSVWSDWSTCTKSCGEGGSWSRTRSVKTAADYGGVACPAATETSACNAHACPVDCTLSSWAGACAPWHVAVVIAHGCVQSLHQRQMLEWLAQPFCTKMQNATNMRAPCIALLPCGTIGRAARRTAALVCRRKSATSPHTQHSTAQRVLRFPPNSHATHTRVAWIACFHRGHRGKRARCRALVAAKLDHAQS